MSWTELPQGQDPQFQPGMFYAADASVSTGHTEADIRAQASKRGLQILSYTEKGPDPANDGYRLVSAVIQATAAASLPWSPGFPASLVAHYHFINVWQSATNDVPPNAPVPLSTPSNPPFDFAPVIVAGASVVLAGAIIVFVNGDL